MEGESEAAGREGEGLCSGLAWEPVCTEPSPLLFLRELGSLCLLMERLMQALSLQLARGTVQFWVPARAACITLVRTREVEGL